MGGFRRLLLRAGWAPVGVVAARQTFMLLRGGFDTSLDPIFHVLGGAAVAFFFREAMRVWPGWFGRPARPVRFFILFCLTVTAALFWEIFEFALGGFHPYSQAHLRETLADLMLGCAGAVSFLCIAAPFESSKQRSS